MSEQFLHIRNIRLMGEGIRGGRRSHRMDAETVDFCRSGPPPIRTS